MYSVVLLMAATAGSQSADYGFYPGGCYGGGYYGGSYHGGGYPSTGYPGHGCYGSAYSGYATPIAQPSIPTPAPVYAAPSYPPMMSGGCYGSSAYSGGGMAAPSYPLTMSGGCYGSSAYSGGAMGVSSHGGCYGGGVVYGGCHGCSGIIISTSSHGCCGGVISPEKPKSDKKTTPDDKDNKEDKDGKGKKSDEEQISSDGPARIVVKLPADARLTIDGAATRSTSAVRTFESPTLKAGRTYSYVLEARFTKDGEEVVVSKKVEVTPGKTTEVELNKGDAVASK